MFGLSTVGALATFYIVASVLSSLFVVTACAVSSKAASKGKRLFQEAYSAKRNIEVVGLRPKLELSTAQSRTSAANHRNPVYNEARTEQAKKDEVAHRKEVIESVMGVLAEMDALPESTKMSSS